MPLAMASFAAYVEFLSSTIANSLSLTVTIRQSLGSWLLFSSVASSLSGCSIEWLSATLDRLGLDFDWDREEVSMTRALMLIVDLMIIMI